MPTGLRRIFSPLSSLTERPFARLVRHFLVRLVRSGEDAASSEVQLGAGALLGLLTVPGALTCFVLLDKYSSLLNWFRHRLQQDYFVISVSDKYLFIALAMGITGIVTVLKWDKILPDAQDYLNLAPLPIRPRTVLLANAAAIAIAVLVFAVDVNAVPAVFFPLFVSAGANYGVGIFLQFAAVHAACVVSASLFTFCAVFALLGAVSAVLPREAFRACSPWLRGFFLLEFLMLLVSGVSGPAPLLQHLYLDPQTPVRFLPPLWFLGMYQTLQHRSTPAMAELAAAVLPGSLAVLALTLLAYGASYRRRFAAALEGGRRPADQRLSAGLLWFLDLFSAGASGFVRGCHRFTVRAILRNEGHRLTIAVAIGLGWLPAWRDGPLAAPLAAAYVLVLGLRVAFEMPAGAPAAWIFRAVLDPRQHETLPVARLVILGFVTPLVLLPALALAWWNAGPATAFLHVLYLLALVVSLTELQLAGYRKIPLTCPLPGFRDRLLMLCLAQFVGFELFTRAGAAIEQWMLAAPLRFLLVPLAMLGAWHWNRQRLRDAREAGELEEGLTFENIHVPAVERLNL
jgi:hypothetical protein